MAPETMQFLRESFFESLSLCMFAFRMDGQKTARALKRNAKKTWKLWQNKKRNRKTQEDAMQRDINNKKPYQSTTRKYHLLCFFFAHSFAYAYSLSLSFVVFHHHLSRDRFALVLLWRSCSTSFHVFHVIFLSPYPTILPNGVFFLYFIKILLTIDAHAQWFGRTRRNDIPMFSFVFHFLSFSRFLLRHSHFHRRSLGIWRAWT